MAITPAHVWEWMGPDVKREGQQSADRIMLRLVEGVEVLWLERWSSLIAEPVTITAVDDLVTFPVHGYAADDQVVFSGLVAADPLVIARRYFVRDATTNTFKVAPTSDGAAIDITIDGTANAPPAVRPSYIDQALIMQAASLYDRRKTLNGVVAGSPTMGPFRVGRFDPDIERMINTESWGVR